MVQIKICGLTRKEDADLAASLGAFALGFIFTAKSKRFNSETNWPMIKHLSGNWLKVGVFQDQESEWINKVAEETGVNRIQLHGKEPLSIIQAMNLPVWKALTIEEALTGNYPVSDKIEFYLLDSSSGNQRGGTGVQFDWNCIPELKLPKPFLIAGGITPDNVEMLLTIPGISMVDVSSGVESEPGIKDPEKLKKLFYQAMI